MFIKRNLVLSLRNDYTNTLYRDFSHQCDINYFSDITKVKGLKNASGMNITWY